MNDYQKWHIKQLRREVLELRREVKELREGRDAKRWPALIVEMRQLEADLYKARAELAVARKAVSP